MDPAVCAAAWFGRIRTLILACAACFFLTPDSASAAVIRGVVVDPEARLVERARVRVVGPIGVRWTTTDASGRFEVRDLPAATYDVLADAPGLEGPAQRITLPSGGAVDVRISLLVAGVSESIVVSASQVEQPLSMTPSTSVVDRAELRARQLDNVGTALQLVPGLSVSRNGGPGALTSVFLRGGDSDFTLVLVDGIRTNTFGGGFDFSQIALAGVESIEVVRGPQSALHGSDAMGGVVHVLTSREGRPRAEAVAEGGARATSRFAASTAGTRRGWSWNASAERGASDGFQGVAPANGETVSNDDWLRHSLGAGLTAQPADDAVIRVTARAHRSERGAPGPYGSDPAGTFSGIDRVARGSSDQRQFSVASDHSWGAVLDNRARQRWAVTWADLDSDFLSAFGPSAFETRRISARSQTDVALGRTGVSAGVEWQAERARSTFVTGEQFQEIPIERRVIGYFGEVRSPLWRSAITAGVRVEQIRRDPLEGDPNPFGPRPPFETDERVSVNPRLSWAWTVRHDEGGAGQTRVHASAATGIRPPDAFEIAFTDNPELKPERSRSVEAGVWHGLVPGAASAQITAFYNTYDDLIVAVGRSLRDASRYRTDNVSNARARGLETAFDWRTPWGLEVRAAYTWLDTEILAVDRTTLAPPPFTPGDRLLRRPRHRASLAVRYTRGPVVAFAEASGRGTVLDVEPNFGASAGLFDSRGHGVIDAGASIRLTRHLNAFARGHNLLDRQYEETLGFPAPGRGGMVGVRVAVGE